MGFEKLTKHPNKPQLLYYVEIYQSKSSVNVELSTLVKCDFLICLGYCSQQVDAACFDSMLVQNYVILLCIRGVPRNLKKGAAIFCFRFH